jgi:hypothetical protein
VARKGEVIAALLLDDVFTVREACRRCIPELSSATYYRWFNEDDEFKAAAEECYELITQRLEQEAHQRAMGMGVKVPSDMLMMFLLNAKRPEVYAHRTKLEHSGSLTLSELVATDEGIQGRGTQRKDQK